MGLDLSQREPQGVDFFCDHLQGFMDEEVVRFDSFVEHAQRVNVLFADLLVISKCLANGIHSLLDFIGDHGVSSVCGLRNGFMSQNVFGLLDSIVSRCARK